MCNVTEEEEKYLGILYGQFQKAFIYIAELLCVGGALVLQLCR